MRITKKIVEELEAAGVVVAGYNEYKGDCPKERIEQVNFISWFRYNHPDIICFHPVNESDVPVQKRVALKEEGMLPGVPDIVILSSDYCVIEMKRKDHRKSEISIDQVRILKQVAQSGKLAVLAFGCDQAKKAIDQFII